MIALNIMLVALAQPGTSTPAPQTAVPTPNVEVIGPTRQNRIICRTIIPSGSHIAARRTCRTFVQEETERDRMQREAEADVESAMRRTNEMLIRSGPAGPRVGESHLPN